MQLGREVFDEAIHQLHPLPYPDGGDLVEGFVKILVAVGPLGVPHDAASRGLDGGTPGGGEVSAVLGVPLPWRARRH